jgi:hypothetical protein
LTLSVVNDEEDVVVGDDFKDGRDIKETWLSEGISRAEGRLGSDLNSGGSISSAIDLVEIDVC